MAIIGGIPHFQTYPNNFASATRFFSNTEVRYEALPRTPNTKPGCAIETLKPWGSCVPLCEKDTCAYTKNKQTSKIKCQNMPNNISNIQSWVIIISCHIKPYHIGYSFTSNHLTYHENIIPCLRRIQHSELHLKFDRIKAEASSISW